MTRILNRRPQSGFVKFPNDFGKRIVDGSARFRTRCDMLIGPCACGHTHQEYDDFVRDLLEYHEAEIEPINLVAVDGVVYIPRYWKKIYGHSCCNVLVGYCKCGKRHRASENWVVELLTMHGAKILNET